MKSTKKPSFYKDRIKAHIQSDLNSFLRFQMNDPRLKFVSITRIELRNDYSPGHRLLG